MAHTYLSYSCLLDFEIIDKDYPTVGLVSKLNNLSHSGIAEQKQKVTFPHEAARQDPEPTETQPPLKDGESFLEEVNEDDMLGEEDLPGRCVTVNGKCSCVKRERPPAAPTAKDCPYADEPSVCGW